MINSNRTAKAIMIQGTASGVGKTMLAMALCRIFRQDGYKVAPFKSQNTTSNTAFTKSGDEIALSQLLQAYAAGTVPDACMNPLILKPAAENHDAQVILNGKYHSSVNAYSFKEMKQALLPEILSAYSMLSKQFDVVVIEGAGSPVELNLNKDDIVNMGVATRVNAPVLLVSDIDRGGIFASLYGTLSLLDKTERPYVKAMAVNRFKGDISHFKDGISILEKITGLPVAGVIPYTGFCLPEEDSLCDKSGPAYAQDGDYGTQFDLIADTVRASLDMELIYKILNDGA